MAEGGQPDERSDVYALGAVCYEALAGRPPFSGATPLAVLRSADRGSHDALASVAPQVPADLAAVVERAMARQPSERFPSAADLAAALRGAMGLIAPIADRSQDSLGGQGAPNCPMDVATPVDLPLRPTREFGMRSIAPLAPTVERDSRRRHTWVVALVALALVGSACLALRAAGWGAAGGHAVHGCTAAGPVVAAGAVVLRADVTGRGCVTDVVWDRHMATATVGATRYALGRDGDRLLLGDWDGDGTATPALYRPTDGRVFLFAAWAGPSARLAPVSVTASGVLDGRPVVASDGGRRQRIEVRSAA